MNAGRELQQLSACLSFRRDSMEEIFDAVKQMALIQRVEEEQVFLFEGSTQERCRGFHSRVSSGPVSFMKVFDAATETVKQGGTAGCEHGHPSCDHPDVVDFIQCKEGDHHLNNFNISVARPMNLWKQ